MTKTGWEMAKIGLKRSNRTKWDENGLNQDQKRGQKMF